MTLPWRKPGGKLRTEMLIFTTMREVNYRATFNKVAWCPARLQAGVPDDRQNGMHALRHHYASIMLAGGVDTGRCRNTSATMTPVSRCACTGI